MRPRFQLSKTRQSPEGKLAFELGLKVGYWPCLKGPFVSLAMGYRRLDLWYGLPTQWPNGQAPAPKPIKKLPGKYFPNG